MITIISNLLYQDDLYKKCSFRMCIHLVNFYTWPCKLQYCTFFESILKFTWPSIEVHKMNAHLKWTLFIKVILIQKVGYYYMIDFLLACSLLLEKHHGNMVGVGSTNWRLCHHWTRSLMKHVRSVCRYIIDGSGQFKILKMSTLQILTIQLYTKFTLNMGLKTLNSGETLKTIISDIWKNKVS